MKQNRRDRVKQASHPSLKNLFEINFQHTLPHRLLLLLQVFMQF